MGRKLLAMIAFNVYAIALLGIFWHITPFIFHGHILKDLKARGIPFNYDDWGWGDHYIWRLLASIFATVLAGFICGALAKEKDRTTGFFANMPSVVGWLWFAYIYLFVFDESYFAGESVRIGYAVVSLIAIPLTCWLAIRSSEFGMHVQTALSQNGRTLGVTNWHWLWMWVPLNIFGDQIALNTLAAIGVYFEMKPDHSILSMLVNSLLLLSVISLIASFILGYKTLTKEYLIAKSSLHSGLVAISILALGLIFSKLMIYGAEFLHAKLGFS